MIDRNDLHAACAARSAAAAAVLLASASALALEVPLDHDAGWRNLEYRGIPANDISFRGGAIVIGVDRSASPLVYRLDVSTRITGIRLVARWSGSLGIPAGATQGAEGVDDFVLKLGLVESGEKTLNWIQRSLAADWIRQLYELAPDGSGVERIHFLSTTQQRALLGSHRVHPLSDLLHETRVEHLDNAGEFVILHRFDEPVDVLGLWISSDGDDTGSQFELVIESIRLETDAVTSH